MMILRMMAGGMDRKRWGTTVPQPLIRIYDNVGTVIWEQLEIVLTRVRGKTEVLKVNMVKLVGCRV
jgi:hypothetical protein